MGHLIKLLLIFVSLQGFAQSAASDQSRIEMLEKKVQELEARQPLQGVLGALSVETFMDLKNQYFVSYLNYKDWSSLKIYFEIGNAFEQLKAEKFGSEQKEGVYKAFDLFILEERLDLLELFLLKVDHELCLLYLQEAYFSKNKAPPVKVLESFVKIKEEETHFFLLYAFWLSSDIQALDKYYDGKLLNNDLMLMRIWSHEEAFSFFEYLGQRDIERTNFPDLSNETLFVELKAAYSVSLSKLLLVKKRLEALLIEVPSGVIQGADYYVAILRGHLESLYSKEDYTILSSEGLAVALFLNLHLSSKDNSYRVAEEFELLSVSKATLEELSKTKFSAGAMASYAALLKVHAGFEDNSEKPHDFFISSETLIPFSPQTLKILIEEMLRILSKDSEALKEWEISLIAKFSNFNKYTNTIEGSREELTVLLKEYQKLILADQYKDLQRIHLLLKRKMLISSFLESVRNLSEDEENLLLKLKFLDGE